MTDKPIAKLYEELGREAGDNVALSYVSPTQEWTTQFTKARFADLMVETLTEQGMDVYLAVNPVQGITRGRGDAKTVTALAALWADLDVKDGGMPSWEAAHRVINSLSDMLNCRPVAVVTSGHGLQPYWPIDDAPISDMNRAYMQGVLRRWGKLVQRVAQIEGGKADSVFDLPRVLRAPGSVNRKDQANPIPVTIEFEEWSHPITVEEIVEMLEGYGLPTDEAADSLGNEVVLSPIEDWPVAEVDCKWAQALASEINNAKPAARHPWLVGMSAKVQAAARNGCLTEDTYRELVLLVQAKFEQLLAHQNPPRTPADGEVATAFRWTQHLVSTWSEPKMRDNLDYHTHLAAVPPAPVDLPKGSGLSDSPTDGPSSEGNLAVDIQPLPVALGGENFRYTDSGNATRLATAALGSFIYTPGVGWLKWEHGRYVADSAESIIQLAIRTAKEHASMVATKEAMQWAQKSLSAAHLAAAVRVAATEPNMVVPATNLDSKALELCTPSGVVNLETLELRAADPSVDFHTKQTAVDPTVDPHPMWTAFLETVLPDPEVRAYVQQLFGLALIGELRYHVLPIFAGVGANGKSTILDICGGVMGDYSAVMPENFLLDSAKLEHSTEIFRLRGVRLAIASETRPDGKFNESRVKMLTGEPVLSARGMRKDFVDFKATHTLMMALNHPPQVKAGGDGFWRRLKNIKFRVQIPEAQRDPLLAEKIIAQEGGAVLMWMMTGAKYVIDHGLVDPDDVVTATKDYRDEEDHLNSWLDEMTAINDNSTHTSAQIYGSYAGWCRINGESPITQTALMRELKQRRPLVPDRSMRSRAWKGLMIYDNEE